MSRSIYDEALDILVESLTDPLDEHDEYCALNYVQMKKVLKAIRKAQKQEKLLELYKYLNENANEYDLHFDKVDEIQNKIKELEK